MHNNDVLRKVRYALDLADIDMIDIFDQSEVTVTRAEVSEWLKADEDPDFVALTDPQLATFLNGLINANRGRKDGPLPVPEAQLTNNIVLRKLKIAMNLQADGMLEILALTDFQMSRHELSALFRKPGHKHFRPCQDQLLRNFLHGMALQYRQAED
ncbi:MAG: DUF1456 family protein [Myxococcales bacterium]|nr:DUF1456 family protein [Myxococcales bacterium]